MEKITIELTSEALEKLEKLGNFYFDFLDTQDKRNEFMIGAMIDKKHEEVFGPGEPTA